MTELTKLSQLLPGIAKMLQSAEAIAEHMKALAESREPEHSDDEVAEWAEDLCADIATVEAEIESVTEPVKVN
jgi:hypothetical protein